MNDWPANLTVAPIREWPGTMTARRRRSDFSASWSSTLEVLSREMRSLRARDGELLVAIAPADFRLDGKPRANAKQQHPGVILSFDSTVGHLSYPCDVFTTWQDNLRGIALALEALRKVDRYGVTKRGEQYRGFLALETTSDPAGFATWEDAWKFVEAMSGLEPDVYEAPEVRLPRLLRAAKRTTHPDTGGNDAAFQRTMLAEAKLREAGRL